MRRLLFGCRGHGHSDDDPNDDDHYHHHPWRSSDWTASDDRVRGGKSISHMTISHPDLATFQGHLDTSALGGAGFASQRTRDPRHWDLAGYEALVLALDLDLAPSNGKTFTLVLKDTVLPRRPDGREQSTTSWEYDFVVPARSNGSAGAGGAGGGAGPATVVMPLADFKPTYRGKPAPDADPLDLTSVRRISFMMRSFFGEQQGDFCLAIRWLAAAQLDDPIATGEDLCGGDGEKAQDAVAPGQRHRQPYSLSSSSSSWLSWLTCGCGRRT